MKVQTGLMALSSLSLGSQEKGSLLAPVGGEVPAWLCLPHLQVATAPLSQMRDAEVHRGDRHRPPGCMAFQLGLEVGCDPCSLPACFGENVQVNK